MWQYLTESSLWSIGGLIIGYRWGRAERNLIIIKKKVAPEDDDA